MALAEDTFTPGAPIDIKDLFAGRLDQLMQVVRGVARRGQHVIMYGERGVGKTSLGNIISLSLPFGADVCIVKVNCSRHESYTELWKNVFREVEKNTTYKQYPPLREDLKTSIEHLVDKENDTTITPDDVRHILSQLPTRSVVIIDELDCLDEPETLGLLADTVKTLSDFIVSATLVLIGVGESAGELLTEHASISRSLTQVKVPRMSKDELREIIEKGMNRLGMTIAAGAKERIVQFSLGIPYYTHLLSLEAALVALSARRLEVKDEDFKPSVQAALNEKKENTAVAYYNATTSPRGVHYPIILAACAIANTDDRGNFSPADVGRALKRLTTKEWTAAQFSRHLREFATNKRGDVLIESGSARRYRYKFRDPLLQPYVILKGISDGRISAAIGEQINA
jgi:Cdc6-like AAA superfamily ATPase